MTSVGDTVHSRVEQWVTWLHENGNDLHQAFAENFSYYLDNVDEFEDGNIQPQDDLPALESGDGLLMHVSILFGITWASQSSVHIILDEDTKQYETLFGTRKAAERYIDQHPEFVIESETPGGQSPGDTIEELRSASNPFFQNLTDAFEHLLDHEHELTPDGDIENVIDSLPEIVDTTDADVNHSNVKRLTVYSVLFGKLLEYSDPALWIVIGENGVCHGVCGDPKTAANRQQKIGGETIAVTPEDNDRHATRTLPD